MNTKLQPIAGALIVGLIGIAHAACYHEQSNICQANGGDTHTWVTLGCGTCEIFATSDWIGWNVTTCNNPDTDSDCRGQKSNQEYCQGPGRYLNCLTSQYVSVNPASNTQAPWNRVDYSATCAP